MKTLLKFGITTFFISFTFHLKTQITDSVVPTGSSVGLNFTSHEITIDYRLNALGFHRNNGVLSSIETTFEG